MSEYNPYKVEFIKKLESERDRLRTELLQERQYLGLSHQEIDRLKAELSGTDKAVEYLKQNRTAWKAKAEKLAKVLEHYANAWDGVAKSALDEYETEGK